MAMSYNVVMYYAGMLFKLAKLARCRRIVMGLN